jgi:hypothetical protein
MKCRVNFTIPHFGHKMGREKKKSEQKSQKYML